MTINGEEQELLGIAASETDKIWVDSLPIELQTTALRVGRKLFTTVMNVKAVNYNVMVIGRRARGNPELEHALSNLTFHLNQLVQALMVESGFESAKVAEVAGDIDRAMALAGAGTSILVPGRMQ